MFGILNKLLDFSKEDHSLALVDNTLVVGQIYVHDMPSENLVTLDDWANIRRVHAKDGALWHWLERYVESVAENAPQFRYHEGAISEVLLRKVAFASLVG